MEDDKSIQQKVFELGKTHAYALRIIRLLEEVIDDAKKAYKPNALIADIEDVQEIKCAYDLTRKKFIEIDELVASICMELDLR